MPFSIGRRDLIKGASIAAAAGTSALTTSAGVTAANVSATGDRVTAGSGIAETETRAGRVAGFVDDGILSFRGIPYGDTTEGANRFAPPRKPKPWTGVRSCRSYGPVCPQNKGTGRLNDEEAFLFQWNDSVEGEDCLRLNVWTPGIDDGGRRPVMVWLHGGGFTAGSGHDLPAFDGRNLSKRGDVVVVTLNHRLNLLGFLDLSAYGDQYALSGNVGMLDIVAALEWVRDNIARFGGDPDRVMIFGQSGGGGKVSALMGMPAARGLFHRAVVESGSMAPAKPQQQARRLAALLFAELGLKPGNVDGLRRLPYLTLRFASEAMLRRENGPPRAITDRRRRANPLGYAPIHDGSVIPEPPFADAAPALSADIPMIIGTTLNEFASGFNHPEVEHMTEAELIDRVEDAHPGRGAAIVTAFRKRTPADKPFDLWSRIASAPMRQGAIGQAGLKAAQRRAPAYLYWFTWQTPVLDGRPRAFHCAELPFVFNNVERCAQMTGGGPRARALAAVVADAWIAFARSGDPNHPGMQQWRPYTPEQPTTMILDDRCRLAMGVDAEELASVG